VEPLSSVAAKFFGQRTPTVKREMTIDVQVGEESPGIPGAPCSGGFGGWRVSGPGSMGADSVVLESGPLRILVEQAGSDVAQGFFDDYLQLLPVRSDNILRGLAAEELKPVRDAVVSLKVASAMAGALRLEGYSGELERQLVSGSRPDASAVKAALFSNIRLILREAGRHGHLPL
jgi:hypothetical protein